MNKKLLSKLKVFIGWPISLISLFFIFKLLLPKTSTILPSLGSINLSFFLIGIIFFFGYFFTRGLLWQKILRTKGHNISLKDCLFLWEMSEFKRYTPGNIWSFLARGVSFTDKGVDRHDVIEALVVEVALIIVSSLVLSLFSIQYLFNLLPFSYRFLEAPTSIFIILVTFAFVFHKKIKERYRLKIPFSIGTKDSFNLLLYATFAFFLFGLGNFFTAYSLFPLYIEKVFVLTGIFVFSLLVGYVSIITPMGLGVREGVVTWALRKMLTSGIAGFISVFTRVCLIISELIFLFSSYLWYRSKSVKVARVGDFIVRYKFEIILGIFTAIYFSYFATASFLRYDNFFAGRFDLGNMDQVVWNTIHGRIFQITDPNGTNIISRLSFHSDFILVLLSPIYLVWSDPKALLLLQTLVLSLGAIFVFLISKEVLKNKSLALAFSASYLLYPALEYSNLFDFHPVTLATTFLLATFYFFMKRRYFLFILFAILAGLTKEEVWVIIALFGLYFLTKGLFKKKKALVMLGFAVALTSISLFYYLIWIAIPLVRGSGHFALSYYSEFGDSPGIIIKNIIFSPAKTFSILFSNGQLAYLWDLFAPLGFLSVFYIFPLVFATPDLLINLLSNNTQLHQIYYQYSATITPFIFISAIYGANYLNKKIPRVSFSIQSWLIIVCTVLSAYFIGPLPGAKNPNLDMFTKPLANRILIENFISKIPKRFSIAATNNLGAHMSHRREIFTVPVGVDKADIVVLLLNDPFAQPSLKAQIEIAGNLEKNQNYVEIFKNGEFVAFEKKSSLPKSLFYLRSPGMTELRSRGIWSRFQFFRQY